MTKLTSLILATVFTLLSYLPLRFLRWLGGVIGGCWWFFDSRSKRVTIENILLCFPDLSAEQREQLARKSLQQLVITALEIGPIWFLSLDKLMGKIASVEGEELIQQALAKEKGVILCAPHIGAWEILGQYLGKSYAMTTMYQPQDNQAFNELMIAARTRTGGKLAPTNNKGVKTLLKMLKRAEIIAILPDQVPQRESGDYADFFSIPALTSTLISNLASRTGAAVITASAYRIDNSDDFRLVFETVSDEINSDDVWTSLTAMNKSVERCVMQAPEQYQWEYKRFKRQPAGERQYYQKRP
jgi:KDO2-lipid IV(A) lauroyltransferase